MPWILELVILLVVVVFVWVMPGCQKKPATKRTLDEATKLSGDPNRKNYKPGHLPEFADPEEKEMDTFYGVKSSLAFPAKNPDGTTIRVSPDGSKPNTSQRAVSATAAAGIASQQSPKPTQM